MSKLYFFIILYFLIVNKYIFITFKVKKSDFKMYRWYILSAFYSKVH